MDVDFSMNVTPVQKMLKKLPDVTKNKIVKSAVRAGAVVIAQEAKDLAPYDPHRSQGIHLRDGITVKLLQGTNDIWRIGTVARKVPHAHLLEFGTIKMPPQPFMRPAADSKKEEAALKIMRRLSLGIFREAKKLSGE